MATRSRQRLGKWLVSGPPLLYLLVFFAAPALIMVLASFRTPGEFGGLAPLVDEAGKLDLNVDSYVALLHRVGLLRGLRQVGVVRDADDAVLPAARLSARDADRQERRESTATCCCCS